MPESPPALTDPALPPDALATLDASVRAGAGAGRGPASLARRLGPLSSFLVIAIVAAAGFIGGVQVQKRQATTTSVAGPRAGGGAAGLGGAAAGRAAAGGLTPTTAAATTADSTAPAVAPAPGPRAGARAGAGAGANAPAGAGVTAPAGAGAGPAAGAAAAGQVKLVDGANLYVTDAQGNTVKVVTTPSSRFTRTGPGSIQDVRPGDTVVVQGQKGEDGIVTATAVANAGTAGS